MHGRGKPKKHIGAAKKYHPDLNPDDKDAEAKFKEVNEAYEVLSDKEKKARYDQFGHAGVDPTAAAGGGYGGYGGVGGFDFGDLGDIFEGFSAAALAAPEEAIRMRPVREEIFRPRSQSTFLRRARGQKSRFRSSAPSLVQIAAAAVQREALLPRPVLTAAAAARSESSSAHRSAPSPPRGHVRAVRERAGLSAAPVRSAMARVRYGCLNGWRSQSRREFMTARC